MGSSSHATPCDKEELSAEGVVITPPPTPSPNSPTGSKKSTLLDIYSTKLTVSTGSKGHGKNRKTWSKKQKRAYHRSLSGIKVAGILGKPLRFMTLTTANAGDYPLLNQHFQALKQRIRRKYGLFEYFKIKTNEGNGVLHVLYRGTYISQRWLRKTWREIHNGTYIVDVRLVRVRKKQLARYLVTQYMTRHGFARLSWSWNWVFRGFVRVWNGVVKRWRGEGLKKILCEWKKILYQHCWKQKTIYDYLLEKPPPSWRLVTDEWWRNPNMKVSF